MSDRLTVFRPGAATDGIPQDRRVFTDPRNDDRFNEGVDRANIDRADVDRADVDRAGVRRIDLHCHSMASTEASEAVLNALHCPESYSAPEDVYAQAKRRGMDFVTLTDHDSIAGVNMLLDKPGIIVGEELTCWFPEDDCKMHVLVWGLNADDHDALQSAAKDIYNVAAYVADRRLAHAVAHPLYRQNDRLERWHLERLTLLFKGFETLNGAHSALHREAFEPLLDALTADDVVRLSEAHRLVPLWPDPHVKARTGGSDDHGLFNIGRTFTEFPADVATVEDVLECLRTGRCRPGGEAGSSLKLAHNFYGVGVRYYTRQVRPAASPPTLPSIILTKLVGDRPSYRKRDLVKLAVKHKLKSAGRRLARPFRRKAKPASGTALLRNLFVSSLPARLAEHPGLKAALGDNRAPLSEHLEMFSLVSAINRDVAAGVADAVGESLARGELGGVFDALSTVAAHQFVLLPYYFALFHQNRERSLLTRLTGYDAVKRTDTLKVGLFTDTFDEVNGVARFVRDMGAQATSKGRGLIVHTCSPKPTISAPFRKNFTPMLGGRLPLYPELELTLPPVAEVLEWADRQQFDAIHVDTPGAMGLCGMMAAKMLRVPLLGTYHTDFPAYVDHFTGDHRLTTATEAYMKWLYGSMNMIFSRTRAYEDGLKKMGLPADRMTMILPGVDTGKFDPRRREAGLWRKLGVAEPYRLFSCGRVSVEKNLPLLVSAYKTLCKTRRDAALVVAGDGPYMKKMKEELAGLPAHFLGYQNDQQLGPLYASSDLFVFPSRTDTLGQVVLEAQASGLPVLVSNEGGPKEVMDDQVTGLVLSGTNADEWVNAINTLLDDEPRRQRMARTCPQRMSRYSLGKTFDAFWEEHVRAAQKHAESAGGGAGKKVRSEEVELTTA